MNQLTGAPSRLPQWAKLFEPSDRDHPQPGRILKQLASNPAAKSAKGKQTSQITETQEPNRRAPVTPKAIV